MPRGPMSDAHKDAIRHGRKESAAVKAYLESLGAGSLGGRNADPSAIRRRLKVVEEKISGESNPLRRVDLAQQRLNLESALAATQNRSDEANLRDKFMKVASSYSKRRGISYKAWRAVGVPAAVLKQAGIARTD